MSVSDDVANIPATVGHDDDVVGENSKESSSRDSNNSNEDGVMVNTQESSSRDSNNNGSGGDSDGVVVSEDAGREDMFMDAPEDLGADGRESITYTEDQGSTDGEQDIIHVQPARFHGLDNEMRNDYMVDEMERLRAMLDKTLNEKESIVKEHKDEMEMAAKGIANLRDQMRDLTNKQLMVNESQPGSHHHFHGDVDQAQLHEMIHECSMFLRSVVEEVQDLNTKSTEVTISREVVSSYMNSVQNESAELQFQKEQYIDDATNRMLSSFASLVYVGDLSDNSTTGKIAHIQKSLYSLVENYNWFLYQSDQLRQCLTDRRPDLAGQADYAVIFAAANEELLSFRVKETDFSEKLSHLEKESSEMKEELDKHKAIAETANTEFESLKAELDQEKIRYSNTKEKLSLAVTKGKALVQQRDTLKQALAGKTSEIENCLLDLKEKSSALEAAELIKEELIKSQISATALQEVMAQKDLLLEKLDDILFQSGLPEGLNMKDITEKTRWLVDERDALKEQNAIITETAQNEMSQLTTSLSTVLVEKDCIEKALEDVSEKFERVLKILIEAAEVTVADSDGLHSETVSIVENCLATLKERWSSSHESSEAGEQNQEMLQNLQSLIYIRDQELVLRDKLLEEETQKMEAETDKLYSDLNKASEEITTLKEQNDNLKMDVEKAEDKSAMIREKLTMAVKKGKGLVQEREGLKQLIEEKSSEIDNLKLELQQTKSTVSSQAESITKLEENLLLLKDQRDQLERDFSESNGLIDSVMESVNGNGRPNTSSFEQAHEKLKWLGEYLSECEVGKEQAEDQLANATVELDALTSKVSESQISIKSLEAALAEASEKFSLLVDEKKELEVSRTSVEQQLQRAILEASLFAEVDVAKKALENALSLAESDVSRLVKEKEEVQLSSVATEAELNKSKLEISSLIADLSEATTKAKDLEDMVSQMETRLNVLNDEKSETEISRATLEDDLRKFKKEAESSEGKLQDAQSSIKPLEVALSKAENDISELSNEKKAVELELSALSAKLNACLEELAGTHGSLEGKTLEFFDHLKGLEVVVEDESVISSLRRCFETKFENFKEVEGLLRNIRSQFAEIDAETNPSSEELSHLKKLLSTNVDDILGASYVTSRVDAVEGGDISSYVQNITESFHVKNKALTEQVGCFMSFVNESNASLLQELLSTSKLVTPTVEKMKKMEADYSALENKATALEDDVLNLVSACTEASQLLELELKKQLQEIISTPEFEEENKNNPTYSRTKHVVAINMLLSASKKVSRVCEQLQNSRNSLLSATEELQSSLNDIKDSEKKAMEERDLYANKVHQLEIDLTNLQNECSELRVKLENYQDIEVHLRDKNAEISSLENSLITKEREAGEANVWASHAKNLMERANKIHVSMEASHARGLEPQDSVQIDKLLHIIDNFPELQDEIESLTHENMELKTALSAQTQEAEQLKERVQSSLGNEQELEKVKSKIAYMEAGLNKIIQKFSGGEIVEDQKSDVNDSVEKLEKLVMGVILESEDLKSKADELELKAEKSVHTQQEVTNLKGQILNLEISVQKIIRTLRSDITLDEKPLTSSNLIQILEDLVMMIVSERETLKSKENQLDAETWKSSDEQELVEIKDELLTIEGGLKKIIQKLRSDTNVDHRSVAASDLLQHLDKMIMALITETETSKSEIRELDSKLLESQKITDELSLKVKSLEDSLQSRTLPPLPPDSIQERSIFEAPPLPPTSEISEIEDAGSVSKATISPATSSTQLRTMWKGSGDHIAINIDSESSRLVDNEDAVENKGHVFKSLNTSGLVPIQGKMIADRIDGLWVSGGRLLMSRPRARFGLIAYWLLLHLFLLGTIL